MHGAAIHASRRTEGVSAIEKFYPILQALADFEVERNKDVDPRMRRWPVAYPISIGTIHNGDWASTVPDLLVAEGRFGIALGEDTSAAEIAFQECIQAAHAHIVGVPLEEYGSPPYGCDLRLLTGLAGIPTVQYGPGDAAIAHAPDEHVLVSELETTARVIS